jgi:Family of unknown function (DUF6263)
MLFQKNSLIILNFTLILFSFTSCKKENPEFKIEKIEKSKLKVNSKSFEKAETQKLYNFLTNPPSFPEIKTKILNTGDGDKKVYKYNIKENSVKNSVIIERSFFFEESPFLKWPAIKLNFKTEFKNVKSGFSLVKTIENIKISENLIIYPEFWKLYKIKRKDFDKTQKIMFKNFKSKMENLSGTQINLRFQKDGKISSMKTIIDKKHDFERLKFIKMFINNFIHSRVVFPDKPIGEGASWETYYIQNRNKFSKTYKLVKIENNILHIEFKSKPNKDENEFSGKTKLNSLNSQYNFQIKTTENKTILKKHKIKIITTYRSNP